MKKKSLLSIKRQIMNGYLIFIAILFVGVSVSILSLVMVKKSYEQMMTCSNQRIKAQEVAAAHYRWLEQLSDATNMNEKFNGSLDPTTCVLGQWLGGGDNDLLDDPEVKAALDDITEPHNSIHSTAKTVLDLAKTDRDSAYELYRSEVRPNVDKINEGLNIVSSRLSVISDGQKSITGVLYMAVIIAMGIFGVVCIVLAVVLGRRIAGHISEPIIAVAKWSEALSTGVDNLSFDSEELENERNAIEIKRMITSFREMSDNIKNHVDVIKRVSSGDLTAYVDIRSDGDSLGRSLYHLVQNNDFMFSNLLQVADSVAVNANQIAVASQTLAESSTTQAAAVESLSSTVSQANNLAAGNAENAAEVAAMIDLMNDDVREGEKKMDSLLLAVRGIEEASNEISIVMKAINDIAFQTNILALNAAVEAARAGAAGKGFAVVADEVRQLAMKSSKAAEESRVLIENTIVRAKEGGNVSSQAADTFKRIVEEIEKINKSISIIDESSLNQQKLIQMIHDEIDKISYAVTENAANSEETAASTEQMNANADEIRQAMERFNLRKREPGKPYIPPEKVNDDEFIETATQNYKKSVRQSSKTFG